MFCLLKDKYTEIYSAIFYKTKCETSGLLYANLQSRKGLSAVNIIIQVPRLYLVSVTDTRISIPVSVIYSNTRLANPSVNIKERPIC